MLIDLDIVRQRRQSTFGSRRTHPVGISKGFSICKTSFTYDGDFATKLILDLTSLDCIGRVLLNELVQVFDTHVCEFAGSCLLVPSIKASSRSIVEWRHSWWEAGEEVTITPRHVSTRAGMRAITVYTSWHFNFTFDMQLFTGAPADTVWALLDVSERL
jgi:hypothetical protein